MVWVFSLLVALGVGALIYFKTNFHVFVCIFYGIIAFLITLSMSIALSGLWTFTGFGGSSLDNDVDKLVNHYLDEAIKVEEGRSDFEFNDEFVEEINQVYYDPDVPAADKRYLGNVQEMMANVVSGNYSSYINQREILESRLRY